MSKQSEAKERQMYVPKLMPMVCGNCKHYKSTITTATGFGRTFKFESDRRCGIGNFAVKKMGSCNEHTYCVA